MIHFSKIALAASLTAIALVSPSWAADIQIGVAWSGKSGMAERVYKGFKERLTEIAPDIQIEFKGALKSIDELDKVAVGFQSRKKDGMVILRSNGSGYLGKNPPSIPTFIGGGNKPSELGSVKNMERPEGNVTGVTYFLPLEGPLESYLAITPEVKSFLLIGQTNYPSTPIDWNGTKEACVALQLNCENATVASREELIALMEKKKAKYDAFILGNQSKVFGNADAVVKAAGSKPVYSYAAKGVELGALGGVIANDVKLGQMLADSLVEVLVNGKKIADVPVKTDPEPTIIINETAVDRMGITIPSEILSIAKIVK